MKVIMLNGSTRKNGCTFTALSEVAASLKEEGVDSKILQMGASPVRDCVSCGGCKKAGECVFSDDIVDEFLREAKSADGIIIGTPVYYAHPSGQALSALDRIFYSGGAYLAHKPAAAVISARRAGTTASFDVINKYFAINQMPIVTSNYWNMVHGNSPDEVMRDGEGLQIMRILGKNMAWILKCIAAGKSAGVDAPETPVKIKTNFIR